MPLLGLRRQAIAASGSAAANLTHNHSCQHWSKKMHSIINSTICDIAVYMPAAVLANDELAAIYPNWSADKILEKTGIQQRHIAGPDETAVDMARSAAERLFEQGKVAPHDVDFLIFCTQAPDYILPTSACLLQDALGLPRSIGALDINLGCSGFVYALSLANGLIQSGAAKCILVVTADTYSKFIHPLDKSVRTLFGDAAVATAIVADTKTDRGVGPFVFGTDGSGARHLIVESGGSRLPRSPETAVETHDASGNVRSRDNLYMDGGAVMAFTLKEVPAAVAQLLDKAGLARDDVDAFVLHQANRFMLDALRKKLGVAPEKMPIYLEKVGNTVSSTIPLVLYELLKKGELSDRRIMLVGFGVGLSWAACMLNT